MKWIKEYTWIAIGYLIVLLYVVLFQMDIVTILLLITLFIIHIRVYTVMRERLSYEKDSSVSRLQTRLEKTKKEQAQISDRFVSLSQSFGSGLLMIDEDGIIQYANRDMLDYFGRDMTGLEYQKVSDNKALYAFLNQAYLLEAPLREQIHYNDRFYDLISTPLFEKELFKGALILAHDITLLKTAEEYQKRFTADVSHELRTPLSAIKGFSEILSRDEPLSDAEYKEFIQLIRLESDRMEIILKDLMEISKFDRIDYELDFSDQNILDVVNECMATLQKPLQESGLALTTDVEPCTLHIDKHRISQVLTNMVRNAINYTDEGLITLLGRRKGKQYELEISDTGIGIAEENYEKIFKRFYRVDKARSRDTGGSGLGLSISKNAIRKHGGTIRVQSKLNQGTTFTITLPIKE